MSSLSNGLNMTQTFAFPEDAPLGWLFAIGACGLLAAVWHGDTRAPQATSELIRATSIAAQSLLVGAPILHVLAVLLGADLLCWRTAAWAAAQSCVTIAPLVAATGSAGAALAVLADADGWLSRAPRTALPGILSLVCAWLACAVIPLDWGARWQVWPVPAVYGSAVGAVLGYGAQVVWSPRRRWRRQRSRAL